MRPPPLRWSTSIPSCQPWPRHSTTPSGHRPRPIGVEAVPSRPRLSLLTARSFSPSGSDANTNGMDLSTQSPGPPHGERARRHNTRPDTCPDATGQHCALGEVETDFHRICPANRSFDGIESQHLLTEASRHWESCPVFWLCGCIPRLWTLGRLGYHGTRARRGTRGHGLQSQTATRSSPHLWRRRRFRRQAIE